MFALCAYGFIASVLPVWMLLAPRDYLSSFLKIGTIALLVVGVFLANPKLPCPAYNPVFVNGGPTFQGHLFPFVFICIMCGAISGFHALVSSGTTPKMIDKESHVRPIGYGAMLMEGLVGIMALIAAASLDPKLYYDINVPLDKAQQWQQPLDKLYAELGNVSGPEHLNLAQVEEKVGGESLRGRTGGAVTLAVGMSYILTEPLVGTGPAVRHADEILVSLRHHVRGAVHPDDHRHRHAHRPLSLAGGARAHPSEIRRKPTGGRAHSWRRSS